jgi:ribosome biogenesis protein SSF1/2
MMVFGGASLGTTLRMIRLPRGPTLTFRVVSYTLSKDIKSLQKRPKSLTGELLHAPVVVLNGFTKETPDMQLTTTMLQNLFPAIHPQTMKLSEAKRVVLFSYNSEKECIDMRHYAINVQPYGVSKAVKKVLSGASAVHLSKDVPDLSKYADVADFVLAEAYGSESEAEDVVNESRITIPESEMVASRSKSAQSLRKEAQQRSVRLQELGPRLELQLLKAEDGICDGDVLYHRHIHLTEEEVKAKEERRKKLKKEKEDRKKQQEANVEKKAQVKDAMREQSRADFKERQAALKEDDESMGEEDVLEQEVGSEEESEEEEMPRKKQKVVKKIGKQRK